VPSVECKDFLYEFKALDLPNRSQVVASFVLLQFNALRSGELITKTSESRTTDVCGGLGVSDLRGYSKTAFRSLVCRASCVVRVHIIRGDLITATERADG
jgi:hypothetical protein